MFMKHQLWILILNCISLSKAWNLNYLDLEANSYVITDVSNYYIRSFLCIKSTNESVKSEFRITVISGIFN